MTSYRVLVTGSRTWWDEETVEMAFRKVFELNTYHFPVTLIHGGADGLDSMAAALAHGEFGWNIEEHLAQWNTHEFGSNAVLPCPAWHEGMEKCKMAGHRRNQKMINTGADICFAFIKDFSKGATTCADWAQRDGIPTRVWRE